MLYCVIGGVDMFFVLWVVCIDNKILTLSVWQWQPGANLTLLRILLVQ
jgi:hypothetical protein